MSNKIYFDEAVLINPHKGLEQGKEYAFVEMADARCFNRHPLKVDVRSYAKGARFADGDSLIAAIEPCMEQGKGFRAEGIKEGFASREFMVLRPCSENLDSMFLYYMMESPSARAMMKKMMTGAAGRRRVDKEQLKSMELNLPDLFEQHKISSALALTDDMVLNCEKRMEVAELLILAAYDHSLQQSTEVSKICLGKLCTLIKDWTEAEQTAAGTPHVGGEHMKSGGVFIVNWAFAAHTTGRKLKFAQEDVLLSRIRPENRKSGRAITEGIAADSIMVLRPKDDRLAGILTAAVAKEDFAFHTAVASGKGTVMHRIDWEGIRDYEISIPDEENLSAFYRIYTETAKMVRNAVQSAASARTIKNGIIMEKMNAVILSDIL